MGLWVHVVLNLYLRNIYISQSYSSMTSSHPGLRLLPTGTFSFSSVSLCVSFFFRCTSTSPSAPGTTTFGSLRSLTALGGPRPPRTLQEGLREPHSHQGGRGGRSEVLILSYLRTTKFGDLKTVKHYRGHPLAVPRSSRPRRGLSRVLSPDTVKGTLRDASRSYNHDIPW